MAIYSYRTPGNNKISSEISTNSYGIQTKKEVKKKDWNFISIEFEYQNSRYNYYSMG